MKLANDFCFNYALLNIAKIKMSTTTKFSIEQKEAITYLLNGAGNICSAETLLIGLSDNDWKIHPVTFEDKIIGAIIQKDADIHTSIAPEYQKRWNPRPYIRDILYPALYEFGEVKSQAIKTDKRGIKWLEKLGFTLIGEDEETYHYKLTEIKFLKSNRNL